MTEETKVVAQAAAEAPAKVAEVIAETIKTTVKESDKAAKRTRASATRRAKREVVAQKAAARRTVRKTRTAARKTAPKAARSAQQRTQTMTKNAFNIDAIPAFAPFQTIVTEANERSQELVKRSQKVAGELADLARANVEAVVEAGRVASEGARTIGQNVVAKQRDSFEQAADAIRS